MKKKLKTYLVLFTLLFSFINSDLKAQWVTIPDSTFVEYLQENFPDCMNGNQMDTTCNGVLEATDLFFYLIPISNLEGIQYFQNASNLTIAYLNVTTIPRLPESIDILNIYGNESLTNIEEFPSSMSHLGIFMNDILESISAIESPLINLYIWGNISLTTIESFPLEVDTFEVSYNSILQNFPTLPNSIQYIRCTNNNLVSIPPLPENLISLECYSNQIDQLPELPNTLKFFDCRFNNLTSIPTLPDSLLILACDNNNIYSLPEIPNGVKYLYCPHNIIYELPVLPNSLELLSCRYNNLTTLPNIPDFLVALSMDYNQIICYPTFPNSLIVLNGIESNPAACLPNYLTIMSEEVLLMPLCEDGDTVNNIYGCANNQGVRGKTYQDINTNCSIDTSDVLLKNIALNLYDEENNLIAFAYSYGNGFYNFIPNDGTYTVAVDTVNKPYVVECQLLDSTFALNEENEFINNINFSLNCRSGTDLGILSIVPTGLIFPGQQHQLNLLAGDALKWYNLSNCGNSGSATVQIIVNGPITYTGVPSTALTPDAIVGDTYTYNLSDIYAVDLDQFSLLLLTDTTALSGDQICVTATITVTEADYNIENNTNTFCYPAVNSYDPNEKQVYPSSVLPGYEDYFTYTIHFQNTGNAPAINIRVLDTLDVNLDPSTFEIINYSHTNTTSLIGKIINFKFNNIFLPDSTSNLEGSKGFIQYKIKPFANLPIGTEIENTANIYFDFNAPIVTNTVASNFETIIGINTYKKEKISVYPNPSAGIFQVQMSKNNIGIKEIIVSNLLGEIIWNEKTTSNNVTIDLTNFSKGMYILKVNDSASNYLQRIIKH